MDPRARNLFKRLLLLAPSYPSGQKIALVDHAKKLFENYPPGVDLMLITLIRGTGHCIHERIHTHGHERTGTSSEALDEAFSKGEYLMREVESVIELHRCDQRCQCCANVSSPTNTAVFIHTRTYSVGSF